MAESGLERANEFSWERVTAKVEDYYGFVIRRLAAQGELPSGFHAEVPPSPVAERARRRPLATRRARRPRLAGVGASPTCRLQASRASSVPVGRLRSEIDVGPGSTSAIAPTSRPT